MLANDRRPLCAEEGCVEAARQDEKGELAHDGGLRSDAVTNEKHRVVGVMQRKSPEQVSLYLDCGPGRSEDSPSLDDEVLA